MDNNNNRNIDFKRLEIGANCIVNTFLKLLKDSKGVQIEKLLVVMGAITGYSCQYSLRQRYLGKYITDKNTGKLRPIQEMDIFVVIGTKDDRKYFFGDNLNNTIYGTDYSLMGFVGGALKRLGYENLEKDTQLLEDIKEIFSYVTSTVGSSNYGTIRLPTDANIGGTAIDYLNEYWELSLAISKQFCPLEDMYILWGGACQQAMLLCKGLEIISPVASAKIIIESAIVTSKWELL